MVGETTRWWWLRHAPCDGPPGMIHPADASIAGGDEAAISKLKTILPKQALWLVSSMRRAAETARLLSLSRPLRVPEFDEQDFGAWTGRSHADLWQSDDPEYRRFWDSPAETAPPGGESYVAVQDRAGAAITRLGAELAGQDLIVVAHAGTIRAAVALALDLPPSRALSLAVDPWSLTRLDAIAGSWRVGGVNLPMR